MDKQKTVIQNVIFTSNIERPSTLYMSRYKVGKKVKFEYKLMNEWSVVLRITHNVKRKKNHSLNHECRRNEVQSPLNASVVVGRKFCLSNFIVGNLEMKNKEQKEVAFINEKADN